MELEKLHRFLLGTSPPAPSSLDITRANLFQAAICFFCIIYTYFRLPEPRGRTFAELDVLFEKKIGARKFASTEVDVFHESVEDKVMNQFEEIRFAPGEKAVATGVSFA